MDTGAEAGSDRHRRHHHLIEEPSRARSALQDSALPSVMSGI